MICYISKKMIQFLLPAEPSGGVYDFACRLQEQIGPDQLRVVLLSKKNCAKWEPGIKDIVVLQYSGYGFAKRGAPVWLLRLIEARRKKIKSFGVFFHELYAFGPPWSSSFWLSPAQRYIAQRLAQISDFWMTNRTGSAQWLRRFANDKPHAALPMFSTIGEPTEPTEKRLPRIIIFGGAASRRRTYYEAGDKLFTWTKNASLEIHDIGPCLADERLCNLLNTKSVIQHGELRESKVRELMQNSLFGLLAYPIEYVAKSSIFAAYCAHGLCPILISKNYEKNDGLVAEIHYIPGIRESIHEDFVRSIGRMAFDWYQHHNLKIHTTILMNLIQKQKAL